MVKQFVHAPDCALILNTAYSVPCNCRKRQEKRLHHKTRRHSGEGSTANVRNASSSLGDGNYRAYVPGGSY
jgi:hypothetical protein